MIMRASLGIPISTQEMAMASMSFLAFDQVRRCFESTKASLLPNSRALRSQKSENSSWVQWPASRNSSIISFVYRIGFNVVSLYHIADNLRDNAPDYSPNSDHRLFTRFTISGSNSIGIGFCFHS